jgi:carbonic anhydrase
VNTTLRFFIFHFSFFILALGCGQSEHHEADGETTGGTHDALHVEGEVHWGYEGEEGPERWAELSPEFALCAEGVEQSPIDLTDAELIEGPSLERQLGETVLTLEQRATVMDIVDNGHTIQVTNDVPMALDVEGVHYELVQYHFHSPSEHTIDGDHAPLEVHFVHKSAAGQLAVIGILFEEGEHDVMWDPVLSALPSAPGEARHIESLELELDELRPLPKRYYAYNGSLTTPPCSEGVEWLVMAEKRQISPEQMATITAHLHDNNRPVRPLGDRELLLVKAE